MSIPSTRSELPLAKLTAHRATWLIFAVLIVWTWLAYGVVLGHQFVGWDDDFIEPNPHLIQGLTFDGVKYAFTTFESGNWLPLTWLSFQLDATLFGWTSRTLHATNLVMAQEKAIAGLEEAPFATRLSHSIYAYCWYLQKTFWPVELTTYYPHPSFTLQWSAIEASAVVLLAITSYVIWRRAPWLIVGWLWFLVSLLPVIGLLQVGAQAYADRYTYVPHIGLFVMVVWEADAWLQRAGQTGRAIGCAVSIGLALVCTSLTRAQAATWHDEEALWTHAIRVDRLNGAPHYILATYYLKRGQLAQADEHFTEALVGLPGNADAILSLARLRLNQERYADAVAYYEWLLQLSPQNPEALESLAKFDKYRLHSGPPHPEAFSEVRRGVMATEQGLLQQGLSHFERAMALDPQWLLPYQLAATCSEGLGRYDDAARHCSTMLQLDVHNKPAWHILDRLRKKGLIADSKVP